MKRWQYYAEAIQNNEYAMLTFQQIVLKRLLRMSWFWPLEAAEFAVGKRNQIKERMYIAMKDIKNALRGGGSKA